MIASQAEKSAWLTLLTRRSGVVLLALNSSSAIIKNRTRSPNDNGLASEASFDHLPPIFIEAISFEYRVKPAQSIEMRRAAR